MNDSTPHASLDEFVTLATRRPLDLTEIETKDLPEGFRPTRAFALIVERIRYGREIQAPLMTITGAHGAGKSTAIRYYANREGVLSWECPPSYRAKYLLADLTRELGISAGSGWRLQTSIVVEQLRANPRTVILDEAQRLNYEGFDLLKYVADQTGSTFALVASSSLESRIERWPDIASRCPVRVRVEAMSLKEFIDIYALDGFKDDTLAEMHKVTKGVMRNVRYLLMHLERAMSDHRPPMTTGQLKPAHIRAIGERIFN